MKWADDKGLGPPSIEIGPLRIWIHGRQFPRLMDYWDGNWLDVTASCSANGVDVRFCGPYLHLSELESWFSETTELYEKRRNDALLRCMEPTLDVTLEAQKQGGICLDSLISPDDMTRERFVAYIDWDALPAFLAQCKAVLQEYPIRDRERSQPIGTGSRSKVPPTNE
jgi:hypothetical protein